MPGIRIRDMFATLKKLSGRDRLQYFWDYFRYPILVTALLLFFFGSVLVQCATYREPYLQVIVVNPEGFVDRQEAWFDEFLAAYGYEYFEQCVYVSGYTLPDENYTYDDSYTAMAVQMNAECDFFIGNGQAYENVAKQGALLDLSMILPSELLTAYEGQILYSDAGGTEKNYPCAIFLEKNPWLEATGCYPDGCYFAVCGQTANIQTATDFAQYVLTQDLSE